MRRILPIMAIILLAGFPVLYGQSAYTFGAKAGISVANQGYKFTPIDYTLDVEPLGGPAFSLFMETFRGEHFSFQVDLSYAHKGCESRVQSITVNHLDHDRLIVNEGELTKSIFHYLSLSSMARYRFGRASFVPYFLLGPRMDILLNYSTDSDYPLDEQNKIILGMTFGAGLEYRLQALGLFTELQYQGDFFPVTGVDPLLVNNHMISLTLGVRWFVSG